MEGEEYPTVSALFDKYLKIYEEVESTSLPSNSTEIQDKVKEAIEGLVKATVLVSELGVFSGNESVDDLPTTSIKFLLLPVLLGTFSIKRTDIDRLEVLRLADIYFRDFMTRCLQYEITDVEVPKKPDCDDEDGAEKKKDSKTSQAPKRGMPTPLELQKMAKEREEKIRRFKEKKATGDRLIELKKVLKNPSCDEDVKRKYYITLVKKFIFDSLEELESIAMEKQMLIDMAALRMKGAYPEKEEPPKTKAFKPILITRDAVQKNVFGLGYPSLPSITIEEFYDQRVRDGWFPDPSLRQNSLQERASKDPDKGNEEEEREEAEKEEAEERDDPEKIARERERDEWRDTHRRGWGNTYNRS
ncbi:immunoglobulin-binding protein 1 isoform X2 [Palaemon carinicauda]|uniref:immunoglobulin-binding protein 1 isoform X2 n=1 Tax=Palaemon carinicauda TaxID=392227 RepID=UPI0035B5BF8F